MYIEEHYLVLAQRLRDRVLITEHDTVDGGGGAPHATCPSNPPYRTFSLHTLQWSWSRLSITKTVQNECGSFIFIVHFYFPRVCWTFYLGTSIYLFARRWKLWQNVPKSFPERIPIIHFWLNTHPQTSPLGAGCSHRLQRRPRWLLETLRKCFCTFL